MAYELGNFSYSSREFNSTRGKKMKVSTHRNIDEYSSLEIENLQQHFLSTTRQFLIRPLINFWRFSCYYGKFIAYRR